MKPEEKARVIEADLHNRLADAATAVRDAVRLLAEAGMSRQNAERSIMELLEDEVSFGKESEEVGELARMAEQLDCDGHFEAADAMDRLMYKKTAAIERMRKMAESAALGEFGVSEDDQETYDVVADSIHNMRGVDIRALAGMSEELRGALSGMTADMMRLLDKVLQHSGSETKVGSVVSKLEEYYKWCFAKIAAASKISVGPSEEE